MRAPIRLERVYYFTLLDILLQDQAQPFIWDLFHLVPHPEPVTTVLRGLFDHVFAGHGRESEAIEIARTRQAVGTSMVPHEHSPFLQGWHLHTVQDHIFPVTCNTIDDGGLLPPVLFLFRAFFGVENPHFISEDITEPSPRHSAQGTVDGVGHPSFLDAPGLDNLDDRRDNRSSAHVHVRSRLSVKHHTLFREGGFEGLSQLDRASDKIMLADAHRQTVVDGKTASNIDHVHLETHGIARIENFP
mmetsp:Transcript_50230/g.98472  ORF Transcript_50230/g.98472 Transcript_50230/m.98472 type:complete len:245 (-) Transcript_50230:745-1479(-)